MPALHGVASWPGAESVVSCTYTFGHGITPGIAILRILPQASPFAETGDLIISDGQQDVIIPDSVGGEYLCKLREKAMADRERQTKAKALSVQVHRLFNPIEEEISCKRVATDGMLIDIAHLIDSKSIEKYQNRYASAAKQLKNCEMSVSGPWPPYHFMPGKLRTVA